jgi:tellurite resistance protein TerC
MDQTWLWIGFNAFVLAMLAVDLLVFHRDAHVVRAGEAAAWTAVWIVLALVFGGGVYAFQPRTSTGCSSGESSARSSCEAR